METWWTEERRKMVTIFSDAKKPESASVPNVWDTHCGNTYVEGLWCKNAAMIEFWKTSQAHKDVKWFFRIMDDSYLHLENLLDLVEQYDPTQKIVLGDVHCVEENYTYPSGGPGILFSRAVLDDWNWEDWMAPLVLHDRSTFLKDDVMWGEYLMKRGIPIINHPGISQAPLDPGGELLDFMLLSRHTPWALPFRPVAIHQQKRIGRMKWLHQLLHSIPYHQTADKMIYLPACTCRNNSHQKCAWDHALVDREICRWASQSLICLGPGPWPNLHHTYWHDDDMLS